MTNDYEERKSASKGQFLSLWATEAVIVGLITSFAYVFAYTFKSNYFSYFDVPASLVTIDLNDVVRSGVFLIAIFIILHWLVLLPSNGVKFVFLSMAFLKNVIILALATHAVYQVWGVTWALFFMLALMLLVVVMLLSSVVSGLRSGLKFSEVVSKELEIEKQIRKKSLVENISGAIGSNVWMFAVLAVITPYLAGSLTGRLVASKESEFVVVEVSDVRYLVVARQADGLVAKEFWGGEKGETVVSIGANVLLIPNANLGNYTFSSRKFEQVQNEVEHSRQSWRQWRERNLTGVLNFTAPSVQPAAPASQPLTVP